VQAVHLHYVNVGAGYEGNLQITANSADQGIRCEVIPERRTELHSVCWLMD
jgi:hypothetical protein